MYIIQIRWNLICEIPFHGMPTKNQWQGTFLYWGDYKKDLCYAICNSKVQYYYSLINENEHRGFVKHVYILPKYLLQICFMHGKLVQLCHLGTV